MYKKNQKVHFVGIGGIGMSGIAELLLNLRYGVSGSDLKDSAGMERLKRLGGDLFIGHRPENVGDADVVVFSSAVRSDNPEVMNARARNIPVIPRAEMLAELMRMKYGIAVAGSHGKTTTTSLIAEMLAHGKMDPTMVIGGRLKSLGTNAKLGQGDFLVAEADESDGSFLLLSPTVAVVTNIDPEHLDHYRDMEKLTEAFLQFMNKVPFYGLTVLCLDHPVVQGLLPRVRKRFCTYGLSRQADLRAEEVHREGWKTRFRVCRREEELGEVRLNIPGIHNVSNALAAVAVGMELGLDFQMVREGLEQFQGIERRFQIKGTRAGVTVVDDYAHHPAEVRATLDAARGGTQKRVLAVFQPHRYTRTQLCFQEFLGAFHDADVLIVTDIYAAGEKELMGVHSRRIVEGVRKQGHKEVFYLPTFPEIVDFLNRACRPGDLVLTLGAGNIHQIGDLLLETLEEPSGGNRKDGARQKGEARGRKKRKTGTVK
jgi:UDP-N-acetylmuramate--alanine ligase